MKKINKNKSKPDFTELKILIATIPCIVVLFAMGLFITYGIKPPMIQCILAVVLGLIYTVCHFKYCIWLVNKGFLVWPRKVSERRSNEHK